MQCLFIKNLYNFYRDFEQFNEKAVGVFCWFANGQLAIGRSAEIDEWRRGGLFRGKRWARAGTGVLASQNTLLGQSNYDWNRTYF